MYPGAERCLCRGLSRMRGNSHVRFLGGGGVAMRCCYPTIISIKLENEECCDPILPGYVNFIRLGPSGLI